VETVSIATFTVSSRSITLKMFRNRLYVSGTLSRRKFTFLDYFESKLSPDTHLSSKELDEYLTPFNLSRNVEIDKSYSSTKNP
jgi:hypothetical protein